MGVPILTRPPDFSSATISEILKNASEDVLFLADPRLNVEPDPGLFDRMSRAITDSPAGLVYSDSKDHPRIDYQIGSIRDNFDFGPIIAYFHKRGAPGLAGRHISLGGPL
jgi:hypothetical protein